MAVPEIVTVSVVSSPRVTAPEKVAAPLMEIMSASDRRHVRCLITQSDGTLHVGNARNNQGIGKTVNQWSSRSLLPRCRDQRARVRRRSVQRGGSRNNQRADNRNRAIDGDSVRAVRLQRHVATQREQTSRTTNVSTIVKDRAPSEDHR